MRKYVALIFTLINFAKLSTFSQNLLYNGGFESPAIASDTLQFLATPTNWTLLPGNTWMFNETITGAFWPAAQNGEQYFDIGNGGIFQSVTIAFAGQFQLSWYDNAALGEPNGTYSVSVLNGSGQSIVTNIYHVNGLTYWGGHTISLNLDQDTYTLIFNGSGLWLGIDALIDNVSLSPSFSYPLVVNWGNPSPIPYGTALTSSQLNATADIPGIFSYCPTNGSILYVGTNILSVIFTPIDAVDYLSVTDSVNLLVFNPAPIINIQLVQNQAYVTSSNLLAGSNYVLQASSDLINWTVQGSVFTATNSMWQSASNWNVSGVNQLFFRLSTSP